jgi:hypothetical protein
MHLYFFQFAMNDSGIIVPAEYALKFVLWFSAWPPLFPADGHEVPELDHESQSYKSWADLPVNITVHPSNEHETARPRLVSQLANKAVQTPKRYVSPLRHKKGSLNGEIIKRLPTTDRC